LRRLSVKGIRERAIDLLCQYFSKRSTTLVEMFIFSSGFSVMVDRSPPWQDAAGTIHFLKKGIPSCQKESSGYKERQNIGQARTKSTLKNTYRVN
jgi:hypothetical protein